MKSFHTTISTGRRVVLPAAFCRAKNLKVGDPVVIELAENAIHIRAVDEVINDVQAFCASFKSSVVDVTDSVKANRNEDCDE